MVRSRGGYCGIFNVSLRVLWKSLSACTLFLILYAVFRKRQTQLKFLIFISQNFLQINKVNLWQKHSWSNLYSHIAPPDKSYIILKKYQVFSLNQVLQHSSFCAQNQRICVHYQLPFFFYSLLSDLGGNIRKYIFLIREIQSPKPTGYFSKIKINSFFTKRLLLLTFSFKYFFTCSQIRLT